MSRGERGESALVGRGGVRHRQLSLELFCSFVDMIVSPFLSCTLGSPFLTRFHHTHSFKRSDLDYVLSTFRGSRHSDLYAIVEIEEEGEGEFR